MTHGIRELLETAKGDVPPPRLGVDEIVAAGRRRRRVELPLRIGGAGVAAVAVLTAAVLVGSNLVVSRYHPATRPGVAAEQPVAPAADVPPLTFMFDAYGAGAYRILPPDEVTLTYQAATIARDYRNQAGENTTAYVGTLTVYRPGVRPPAVFMSGTKVTVQGLPGYAGEREQDSLIVANGSGVFTDTNSIAANTLAWQYQANSWAVINSFINDPAEAGLRLTAADERALADKFSLGAPSPARVPFRVGYLPPGWTVVSVTGRSFAAEDTALVTVIFAPASSATTDRIRHFADVSDGTAVAISIGHKSAPPPDAPGAKNTCTPMSSDTDPWCSWDIPNTGYNLVVHDPADRLSSDELIRIGQGLQFDNLDQPDTWHPVP